MSDERVMPDTAAAIAELGRAALDRHLTTGELLDGKAWAAVAAGSVVAGLGAVASTNRVLLVFAPIAYGVVAWSAVCTVRPRQYSTPPDPQDAWNGYWNRPLVELHHALIQSSA